MRIVHATSNICGLPQVLAAYQRQHGYQADAVLYPISVDPPQGTVDLARLLRGNRITRRLRRARVIAWVANTYDVFHFHFHTTFAPDHADMALLAALGKRIIFHLHGCDIRDPRRARAEHWISACSECTYPCLVPVKLRLPETLRRYAHSILVSTPDLVEFASGAQYVPNPLDAAPWEAMRRPTINTRSPGDDWVVVHAPTNREIKGTRHVVAAVERLRQEGFPVQLRIYEGLPQAELRRLCVEADVVVDQLFMGWVGMFGLEMMALGKPVVAYIRPSLQGMLEGMPVVHADPLSLAATLRALLLDPERRASLSTRGPAYVRERHDPDAICKRLEALYHA